MSGPLDAIGATGVRFSVLQLLGAVALIGIAGGVPRMSLTICLAAGPALAWSVRTPFWKGFATASWVFALVAFCLYPPTSRFLKPPFSPSHLNAPEIEVLVRDYECQLRWILPAQAAGTLAFGLVGGLLWPMRSNPQPRPTPLPAPSPTSASPASPGRRG